MSVLPDLRAVVEGDGFRITVLTSRLIRLEYAGPTGDHVDAATAVVVNRSFDVPSFTVVDEPGTDLQIWTEHLHVTYDRLAFSPTGLCVAMRHRSRHAMPTAWRFGDAVDTLAGTARTLDLVDGACELEPGILAQTGFALLDDSTSVLQTDDGWIAPRPPGGQDLYFFGYGQDYSAALRDYFQLTGPTPLVPRFVLGNWWSRYHRYSATEYLDLMDRFAAADIPLSVAVVDMDWHHVDIDPAIGNGWTGYTWNEDLFPDPPAFLAGLHDRGLAVTLNVHPADGVRRHESAYADLARDLGIDPQSGQGVPFDITSREFVAAYLRHLHHPLEAQGVDFWWIDWQSGGLTRMPGLDPLWMLNRVHYADSARDGGRALTFSRYAGPGSHRHPIGFSGDTVVSWASLAFQPFFTATAANIGYYWWSHDIGGHMWGVKDDELATRWVQLGAFSPVNRLHSTNSPFNSKEPWRFGREPERLMTAYLRLRHALVPYLYSAAWAAHTRAIALVRPMYHDHPHEDPAYEVPEQFAFGPDLVVAPIVTPLDAVTGLGSARVWLPAGEWVDVISGHRYVGGRTLVAHRPLDTMPVFARAGSILPLAGDLTADVSADPTSLVLRVAAGAPGEAVVIEDDGSGEPAPRETTVRWEWWPRPDGSERVDAHLVIDAPQGAGALRRRSITVQLMGVASVDSVTLDVAGAQVRDDLHVTTAGGQWNGTPLAAVASLELGEVDLSGGIAVHLWGVAMQERDVQGAVFGLLDAAQMEYALKEQAMTAARQLSGVRLLAAWQALDLPGVLYGALTEVVTALG